jgi:Ca-activated chloride channel family protein
VIYALLGAIAALIALLHLLKPRPQPMVVPSTLLWASVAKQRKRRDRLWRWWLSLLLCLAVGLAIGFALTRSDLPGAVTGTRMVLVLDNSPSMAARTRDGKTRWLHALEQARGLIEASRSHIMLLDTMGRAPVTGFVARAEALAVLDRLRVASGGVPQLPAPANDASADVHVLSDGVAAIDIPVRAVVHSVYEAADNIAVTALDVRPFPTDPLRFEAFVQVFNASAGPKHARLTLRGGERFALSQELDLAPGELVDASFDVSRFEGGVLAAAALTQNDAFAMDDVAFATMPEHRSRQVVLVTRGNARLEDCLRSLAGLRLRTILPAQYRDDLGADAYVFDSFAPDKPPAAGALLFHPPAVSWLPAVSREVLGTTVSDWDRSHVLTDGVAWHDLRIRRAALRLVEHPVVSAANGTLIATGKASAPWIAVGFAPQDSNLALQTGFPVFVGNALSWLSDAQPPAVRSIGTVHVPLADAYVTDGSGARIASRNTPEGTVFEAARPDVYTVRSSERHLQVVANMLDPRLADINHSRFADRAESDVVRPPAVRGNAAPWIVFLLAGVMFLLLEWAAYTRRITL